MSLAAIAVTGVFLFSVAALVVSRAYCYTAEQHAKDAAAAVDQCAKYAKALGVDISDDVLDMPTRPLPVQRDDRPELRAL
jgi:hypothetical protein